MQPQPTTASASKQSQLLPYAILLLAVAIVFASFAIVMTIAASNHQQVIAQRQLSSAVQNAAFANQAAAIQASSAAQNAAGQQLVNQLIANGQAQLNQPSSSIQQLQALEALNNH